MGVPYIVDYGRREEVHSFYKDFYKWKTFYRTTVVGRPSKRRRSRRLFAGFLDIEDLLQLFQIYETF